MPRRQKPNPRLEELQRLSGEAAAQSALAVEILEQDSDVRAIRAAVGVLKQQPTPAARPALVRAFEHYAADGIRRDAGTYLRSTIVQALRQVARPDDLPLFERAATTYEFLPPARSEEASMLRSAALVAMNEVDGELAAYHAVRLLADPHTSRLSGEPALTAVRLLGARENRWPLYYYVLHRYEHPGQVTQPVSEVLSECLKSLAGMPASLVGEVLDQHCSSADEVVLVGLIDLALEYPGSEEAGDFLRRFLSDTRQYGAYRYLAARLVASHEPAWRAVLIDAAGAEQNSDKLAILEPALAMGEVDADLKPAIDKVRARLRSRRPTGPGLARGA